MGVKASQDWLGVILIIIGALFGTVWNLGTNIDLSNVSTTILNPFFAIGIILIVSGVFVIQSNR